MIIKALQTRQCSAAATMPAGIGEKSTFMGAKTFSKETFLKISQKRKTMQTFGGSRRGAGFEALPPSLFCAKAVLLREARSRDLTLAPLLPQNLQISRGVCTPNLDNQSRADLFSCPAEKGKS